MGKGKLPSIVSRRRTHVTVWLVCGARRVKAQIVNQSYGYPGEQVSPGYIEFTLRDEITGVEITERVSGSTTVQVVDPRGAKS